MKIKFELRMLLHLCLKKKNLEIIQTLLYFWKKTDSWNYQNVIVFSKKSIVNENWFQKAFAIKFIIVKMMILKQSKRKKTFSRRRKFDVLIEFI
jgi:hypothetical protein